MREFKWVISSTDGHVTAHKILEFINRRTGRDVIVNVNSPRFNINQKHRKS